MLVLKLFQLVIGIVFCYMGFELRIRHNYRVLRMFGSKKKYSGNSRSYGRRTGRICLYGGLVNLVGAIAMLLFVPIEADAPVGAPHRIVAAVFLVGVAALFVAILVSELYNLRRYAER